MLFRLGLRLKKEGDAGGAGLSHKLKLPYTMIVITILKSVPIWVYVMATIFSLLVLTLLTYGLYKCGFFRREKREELAKLTQQVGIHSILKGGSPAMVSQKGHLSAAAAGC